MQTYKAVPWIGKITGCFTSEYIVERLGYKKTAFMANTIQIVGVTRQCIALSKQDDD